MILLGGFLALFVGLSLGVIGAGGSILTVPLLHYIMGLDALTSTGVSLLVVGSTAAVAAAIYARQGHVEFKKGLLFAVPGFFGVSGARQIFLPMLPDTIILFQSFSIEKDTLILVVFAVVMLIAAVAMIKSSKKPVIDKPIASQAAPPTLGHALGQALIGIQGFVVGALSGFVGAGGGFLIIPALTLIVGLEMKKAIATSLFIIALNSAVGVGGDLLSGSRFPLLITSIITSASLVGMLIGIQISKKLDARSLRPAFGVFILVIATVIMAKELL